MVEEHKLAVGFVPPGEFFSKPAFTLREQRQERRVTLRQRCEAVASVIAQHDGPSVSWCHLNDEGDLLERLIPDAVQVSGGDSDDNKEARLEAFANGQARILITKPKIGAWGLNFQHCNHVTFFPSHSFEQYYQAVRRCWRFGQKRPVRVDLVTTDGERGVMQNLQRKADQADAMFSRLVAEMNHSLGIERANNMNKQMEIPKWL